MLGFQLVLGTGNVHVRPCTQTQAMDESGDHLVSYREFFGFVKSKAGVGRLHGELRVEFGFRG